MGSPSLDSFGGGASTIHSPTRAQDPGDTDSTVGHLRMPTNRKEPTKITQPARAEVDQVRESPGLACSRCRVDRYPVAGDRLGRAGRPAQQSGPPRSATRLPGDGTEASPAVVPLSGGSAAQFRGANVV